MRISSDTSPDTAGVPRRTFSNAWQTGKAQLDMPGTWNAGHWTKGSRIDRVRVAIAHDTSGQVLLFGAILVVAILAFLL